MSKENNQEALVEFDINRVMELMGSKVANLEVQLAHSQAANEAYARKVKAMQEEMDKLQSLTKSKKKD